MTKYDFRSFTFFGNNTKSSKKRADKQRRGRQCRIEELEGREMLSVSPWALSGDIEMSGGHTPPDEVQTYTPDVGGHKSPALTQTTCPALTPLADSLNALGTTAKFTDVKGLKQVKGVKNSAMTLSTITLQFNAASLNAETDKVELTISSGKKATLQTWYLVFAKETAGSGWKVVNDDGLKINEAELFKLHGAGFQDPGKAAGKMLKAPLYTLNIGGLATSTKYTVKFQSYKNDGSEKSTKAAKTSASTLKYDAPPKMKFEKGKTGDSYMTVSWRAYTKAAPLAVPLQKYEIFCYEGLFKTLALAKDSALVDHFYTKDGSTKEATVGGLKAAATYTFFVRAIGTAPDGDSVYSLAGKMKKKTTTAAKSPNPTPTKPEKLNADAPGTTKTQDSITVVLDSTKTTEVRYREKGTDVWLTANVEIVDGKATIAGLDEGTEYEFQVREEGAGGSKSVWSDPTIIATNPATPVVNPTVIAPVSVGAAPSSTAGHIVVTWTAGTSTAENPAANGFRVEWSKDSTFATGMLQSGVLAATTATYTIKGDEDAALADGTWYVRVVALGNGTTTDNALPVAADNPVVIDSTPIPTRHEHVIDFEFLAGDDYLGLNNFWTYAYPDFVQDELGLIEAEQYGEGIMQFFVDGIGFTYNTIPDWSYWCGFSLSTSTDTEPSGYDNEMSSVIGTGADGSQGYGIAFWAEWESTSLVMQLPAGAMIDSMMVTNTVLVYHSMMYGDGFADPLEAGQYQTLVVVGLDAEGNLMDELGSVTFDLGRGYDDGRGIVIVSDWEKLDLSSLAGCSQLQFSFDSNVTDMFGLLFPTYFAFDDIVYYMA